MERNYMRSWLVGLAVIVGGAAVAQAQEPPPVKMIAQQGPNADQSLPIDPIGPLQTGTVADAQLFKEPDLTQIGTYPEMNYGPFFQYERLYWSLHQPPATQIGDANQAFIDGTPNDSDTGFMHAGFVWGNRFDLGYVNDENSGWLVSILKTNTQFNTLNEPFMSNVTFINNEPLVTLPTVGIPSIGGNPGVPGVLTTSFPFPNYVPAYPDIAHIEYRNFTRMAGVELMKTYRYPVSHNGGVWSFGFGARFLQLHDRFDAAGESTPSIFSTSIPAGGSSTATPAPFAPTPAENQTLTYGPAPISWDLGIDNDIVGPQAMLTYDYECDRWTFGSQFRAVAGANFENAAMYGWTGGPIHDVITGAGIDELFGTPNTPSNQFFSKSNRVEFAPLGELRLNFAYKVTQNVSLTAGYTAIFMTGIGRASQRIEYTLPDVSIINGAERQSFFADGVNFGFEINR